MIQELVKAEPKQVMFWTGAGVSHGTPSCLPMGNEMSHLVKRTLMYESMISLLEKVFCHQLRLEELLEAACRIVNVDETYIVHDIFRNVEPNAVHFFLAEHIHNSGCVVTMNIDQCIDDAYLAAYRTWHRVAHEAEGFHTLAQKKSLHGWLIKPHGALFHSPLEEYGWTISNVRKGLDPQLGEALQTVLKEGVFSFIVFCGYSGRDDFDVNPFFERVRGEISSNVTAIWIKHGKGRLRLAERSSVADGNPILQSFEMNSYVYDGDTWEIFDTLRRMWGYDTRHERPHEPSLADKCRFDRFFDTYVQGLPTSNEKFRVTVECASILAWDRICTGLRSTQISRQ